MAASVNQGKVADFQPNTKARASEMDRTINARITAIDDNAAQISAIEAIVTPVSNLTGAVFCLYEINNSLKGSEDYS
jgi:hypothetical protein